MFLCANPRPGLLEVVACHVSIPPLPDVQLASSAGIHLVVNRSRENGSPRGVQRSCQSRPRSTPGVLLVRALFLKHLYIRRSTNFHMRACIASFRCQTTSIGASLSALSTTERLIYFSPADILVCWVFQENFDARDAWSSCSVGCLLN